MHRSCTDRLSSASENRVRPLSRLGSDVSRRNDRAFAPAPRLGIYKDERFFGEGRSRDTARPRRRGRRRTGNLGLEGARYHRKAGKFPRDSVQVDDLERVLLGKALEGKGLEAGS